MLPLPLHAFYNPWKTRVRAISQVTTYLSTYYHSKYEPASLCIKQLLIQECKRYPRVALIIATMTTNRSGNSACTLCLLFLLLKIACGKARRQQKVEYSLWWQRFVKVRRIEKEGKKTEDWESAIEKLTSSSLQNALS